MHPNNKGRQLFTGNLKNVLWDYNAGPTLEFVRRPARLAPSVSPLAFQRGYLRRLAKRRCREKRNRKTFRRTCHSSTLPTCSSMASPGSLGWERSYPCFEQSGAGGSATRCETGTGPCLSGRPDPYEFGDAERNRRNAGSQAVALREKDLGHPIETEALRETTKR